MNYYNYIKGIFGCIFGDIFGEFHLDNEISNKLFMKIDKINELRIPQLRKEELIEREFDGVYCRERHKRFNEIKTIKEKYKVGFILKFEEASKVGKQYIIYQKK